MGALRKRWHRFHGFFFDGDAKVRVAQKQKGREREVRERQQLDGE